jgi:putative endonuclease
VLPPPKVLVKTFRRTRQNAFSFCRTSLVEIKMYYTYILLCEDKKRDRKKFYIGFTNDLKERILAHKSGAVQTTKSFDKIILVYYEACLNEKDARKRELKLKTGFGRGYINKRIENFMRN